NARKAIVEDLELARKQIQVPRKVGPRPIKPASPRKPQEGLLASVVIGAAMPNPSVMLCSAKPTASTPVKAIAPMWADSPIASPSDRLCRPRPVAMARESERALGFG